MERLLLTKSQDTKKFLTFNKSLKLTLIDGESIYASIFSYNTSRNKRYNSSYPNNIKSFTIQDACRSINSNLVWSNPMPFLRSLHKEHWCYPKPKLASPKHLQPLIHPHCTHGACNRVWRRGQCPFFLVIHCFCWLCTYNDDYQSWSLKACSYLLAKPLS